MKKRRVEDNEEEDSSPSDELLTTVNVVCRERPDVFALPHVTKSINEFIDFTNRWTLLNAVKRGSSHLITRVLANLSKDTTLSFIERRRFFRHGMEFAATKGDLPLLQLLSQYKEVCLEVALVAAVSGDLEQLKWIQATTPQVFHHHQLWVEQVAFDIAAERGELETVQWLVNSFPGTAWRLASATRGGHLEMVKWLHLHANLDTNIEKYPRRAYASTIFASCCKHFEECRPDAKDMLEHVVNRFCGDMAPQDTDAMDFAAEEGHLEVLKWLHVNRSDGCSAQAVNGAAAAANMEILLWLHEHYANKWTSEAADCAAANGHLEVVQWMHGNRSEGCTIAAMNLAAKNGHLEMARWLDANRKWIT